MLGVVFFVFGEVEYINEFVLVEYNDSKYSIELNNYFKCFD